MVMHTKVTKKYDFFITLYICVSSSLQYNNEIIHPHICTHPNIY